MSCLVLLFLGVAERFNADLNQQGYESGKSSQDKEAAKNTALERILEALQRPSRPANQPPPKREKASKTLQDKNTQDKPNSVGGQKQDRPTRERTPGAAPKKKQKTK